MFWKSRRLSPVSSGFYVPGFRRFLVNTNGVRNLLEEAEKDIRGEVVLAMRIYVPKVDNGISYNTGTLQTIVIFDPHNNDKTIPSFFYPNTTTLIQMKVDRRNNYVKISTTGQKH
ncbi:MAG: hypothetical protein GY940_47985 [bacterium]|nr:hypothetical protein [bacterium]